MVKFEITIPGKSKNFSKVNILEWFKKIEKVKKNGIIGLIKHLK